MSASGGRTIRFHDPWSNLVMNRINGAIKISQSRNNPRDRAGPYERTSHRRSRDAQRARDDGRFDRIEFDHKKRGDMEIGSLIKFPPADHGRS